MQIARERQVITLKYPLQLHKSWWRFLTSWLRRCSSAASPTGWCTLRLIQACTLAYHYALYKGCPEQAIYMCACS